MDLLWWQGNYVGLDLSRDDVADCSHPGPCDDDVNAISRLPYIAQQLDQLSPADIRSELAEYGAWDEVELSDDDQNRQRLLWVAAGALADQEACA